MTKPKLFFLILIISLLVFVVFVFGLGFIDWLKNIKTQPEIPTLVPIIEPTATGGGGGSLIKEQ